ncbi:unnamed protein product [Rangifer tarandus platyrhynchus]|uniref:Uncharacterized protein n=1 Tax=Rangifer tarandus platyrhynchus TaxID=3082113 RepID=A0ABN8XL50_RANTA|nr:unnamed protein product [Rangifer tarandus platyrhynchus]
MPQWDSPAAASSVRLLGGAPQDDTLRAALLVYASNNCPTQCGGTARKLTWLLEALYATSGDQSGGSELHQSRSYLADATALKRNRYCASNTAYGCSAFLLDLCSGTLLGGDSDAARLPSNAQSSPDPFGRE